jgi:hypothetical protein
VAFTEDIAQFFEENDFAVESVVKNGSTVIRTISVILNTPTQETAIFDAGVELNLPFVQCRTSDLAGVRHGFTMTISSVNYQIIAREDDGTGVSTVQLKGQ